MTAPEHIDDDALRSALHILVQRLGEMPVQRADELTPVGEHIEAYLQTSVRDLPVVTEDVAGHRLVDADIALSALADEDPASQLFGIGGGRQRLHEDFASLISSPYAKFGIGAVEYARLPVGPHQTRQAVAFGARLLTFDGTRFALLQRAANPSVGRQAASIEVIADDPEAIGAFLERFRTLMNERSVLRGQVIGFAPDEFGNGLGRMSFMPRPDVCADDVILPEGVLERIRAHTIEIGARGERLRALGQHLKRGILLYGPPGTGKTLTVRHLLTETPGTTAVVLQGGSLAYVGEAARLARALAPAMIVLEDVDLVAMERGMFGGPQPLLFEILDAMDGVAGDADLAFILTTNRADVLEPALAERPGRVDLAVEIPLPDAAARRALFRTYAAGLPLDGPALDAAADRADGVTASFAKELVRRTVLRGELDGSGVTPDTLEATLTEMLEGASGVSRALFGGHGAPTPDEVR